MKSLQWTLTRAAIVAVVLALTSIAHADVMAASWQKASRGTLKLTMPTQVGDLLLPAGAYEVKVRNTDSGAEIEFARWNYDPYAAEGLPVYSREVVATVKASPQTAKSASSRTGLLLASGDDAKAIGVQIRGDSVDYLF